MNGSKDSSIKRTISAMDKVAPARTFWQIAAELFGRALFAPLPPPEPPEKAKDALKALGSERRQAFIKAYNRNAMNFLPGAIAHNIYRRKGSQKAIEARAKSVLEGDDQLHIKAMARGYTG